MTVPMTGCWQILSQWLPQGNLLAIAPVSDSHHGWLLAVPATMTAYGNFIGYCPCQEQSPWLAAGSSCHNDCLWQLYWLLSLSVTVTMADYWQFLSQWLPMAKLLAIAPVSNSRHDWLLAVFCHNDCLWQLYWLLPLSVTVAMTGYWQFPVTMTAYGNSIGSCPCQ